MRTTLCSITLVLLLYVAGAFGQDVPQPEAASLRAFHELLGSEPHVAGTPGDQRTIDRLVAAFEAMGLEVQIHEFWPLLCRPIDARLEILQDSDHAPASTPGTAPSEPQSPRRGVIALPIREDDLLEDPAAAHPDLSYGWNAYSGSGDVTAEVVYANYGTRTDFQKLKELGIDCTGRIVLARYGGNFRGYKAKFAEEAGAAGLIIFTDPADSGYAKGLTYPEGGWANATCIQRGSLLTLPYIGDPLTPNTPATKDAVRLSMSEIALPSIPVQPIGFAAAQAIMSRMKAAAVPSGWQGGLPFTYRLEGGSDLKVRLMVKQERAVMRTANVIARLRGSEEPDREVIIGCHHDAWGFGAADPLAGTICLLESARNLADRAKQGWRPKRTIVWAAWGAEEFGILGSTEWVEQYASHLSRHAVAYINLDMAAMGPNFGASASPSLRQVIADAATTVPACGGENLTLFDAWLKRRPTSPSTAPVEAALSDHEQFPASFGELGGGSDHVGFYCHLGIPSCALGGSGSEGTSYHSNYDNLVWYRKVVGEDYAPAAMVTAATTAVAVRCANELVLPLEPWRTASAMASHLRALNADAAFATEANQTAMKQTAEQLDACSLRISAVVDRCREQLDSPQILSSLNDTLIAMDRAWLVEAGLNGRPWFRNSYASTDRYSGYATSTAPLVREAIEDTDQSRLAEAIAQANAVLQRLNALAAALESPVGSPDTHPVPSRVP